MGEASNGELESPPVPRQQQQRGEAAPKLVGEFFRGRWSMLWIGKVLVSNSNAILLLLVFPLEY